MYNGGAPNTEGPSSIQQNPSPGNPATETMQEPNIDLSGLWLASDRPDRLVYRPGLGHWKLPMAFALVLAFCASVAYPRAPRPGDAAEAARLAKAVDDARADALRRGQLFAPPPLPPSQRRGASSGMRLFYLALTGLFGLAACAASVLPLRHRIEFRVDREAGAFVVRRRGPLGFRQHEAPLASPAKIVIQRRLHFAQGARPPSARPSGYAWGLAFTPGPFMPHVETETVRLSAAPVCPPRKTQRLADRLGEMTGWPVAECEVDPRD